ncbi:MAG: DUF4129 domain-containing protein [Planctomycetota bacterium]
MIKQCSMFVIALSVCFANHAFSDDSEQTQSVEASDVQAALANSPWYDTSTESRQPVSAVPTIRDSDNRDSRWVPKPKTAKANPGTGTTGGGTSGLGSDLGRLVSWSFLIVLLLAIVGIVAYVLKYVDVDGVPAIKKEGSGQEIRKTMTDRMVAKIKHLPEELRQMTKDPRSAAQELASAGDLQSAMVQLFGYQLLLLDSKSRIRLARGKTNRVYIRECRREDSFAADKLRETVEAFERVFFGDYTISKEQFDNLWNGHLELEKHLGNVEKVA